MSLCSASVTLFGSNCYHNPDDLCVLACLLGYSSLNTMIVCAELNLDALSQRIEWVKIADNQTAKVCPHFDSSLSLLYFLVTLKHNLLKYAPVLAIIGVSKISTAKVSFSSISMRFDECELAFYIHKILSFLFLFNTFSYHSIRFYTTYMEY